MSYSWPGLSRASQVLILVAVGSGLFGLGVLVGSRFAPAGAPKSVAEPLPAPAERPGTVAPPAAETPPSEAGEPILPPSPEGYQIPDSVGARIALVIDDLGRSLEDLASVDALGVPLTYSVLPFETRTRDVVAEITRQGWELICHLPMEPQSGADPGPGALTSKMTAEELASATRTALSAVPGAVGVNNHMGSSLSADVEAMGPVLEVVAERDLFFLDSRTSAASVGYRMALERGLPTAERQVFLDPELTTEAVEEQFDRLLWLARDRGQAVAIGHPHPVTFDVLARRIPEALAAGYEFVPVSYLLDRMAPPE